MDNKKFEKVIELFVNENEDQARELFHEVVIETSRKIYESIMDDEMIDMEDSMTGQVGDLMDEISAEQTGGMTEDEDEFSMGADDEVIAGDETVEFGPEDTEVEHESEEIEDAVIRIEDKLDQLMAEFEEIMGSDDGESDEVDSGEMDSGEMDSGEMDSGEFVDDEEDIDPDTDSGDKVMEAVTLKKVGGATYNTFGKMGDNGAQTKSPGLQNSGQAGMDSKPVKFSGQSETVPAGPKAPSNAYTKGESQVKHATQWKNAPAQTGQDLEKAPQAVKTQATGVNTKSPVSESKKARPTRKIVK